MRKVEDIKAIEYGYGELEDKLITLFRSGKPDFETADELIRRGADINAEGQDDEVNILSEILCGYWESQEGDDPSPDRGEAMLEVIRYFLNHGFDVNKKDGRYGAQCLFGLTLSVFDRHIIDATKLLLKAGVKNINITSNSEDNETPWGIIGMEGSAQEVIYNDHHMGNIYEAVYQIYQAMADGKDYSGIDSYEEAIGKRVLKVLSAKPKNGEPFLTRTTLRRRTGTVSIRTSFSSLMRVYCELRSTRTSGVTKYFRMLKRSMYPIVFRELRERSSRVSVLVIMNFVKEQPDTGNQSRPSRWRTTGS